MPNKVDYNALARPSVLTTGAFVPELADLPIEEIRKVLGRQDVAKLSFNENPYGPSPRAVEAMQVAAQTVNLYQDSAGTGLRQAIAKGLKVDPEAVILSNGADEMIVLTALSFLDPGDEVVIPGPTFGQYAASVKTMGARPVSVPLQDYRINVVAAAAAVTKKTKMMFICNPNNPTGTFVTGSELEQLLAEVPDDVVVVVDEAYIDYVTDKQYQSAVEFLGQYPNVFVIRTFSKLHALAGARVGYGVGNPELVKVLHRVRPPFNVNGVAQAGAKASLEDTEYQARMRQINAENRQYFYSLLDQLGIKYVPSQTNFVLVDADRNSTEVFTQLLGHGVVVRDVGGSGLSTCLRITVGTRQQMDLLHRALRAIGF